MRFAFVAQILSVLLLPTISQSQTIETPQLIQDVRAFDGESVLEHRSVLIETRRISRISDAPLHYRCRQSGLSGAAGSGSEGRSHPQ